MLIKLNPIFQTYARHREEKVEKALSHKQWIYIDRILMIAMFVTVIIAAIAFS